MVDDQENLYPTYFDDFVVQRIKAADELVFDALYQGRISYSKDPNIGATDSIIGSLFIFQKWVAGSCRLHGCNIPN